MKPLISTNHPPSPSLQNCGCCYSHIMPNPQAPSVRHVVAIPYPAQGHITPLLQLCHQLVPLGFTFTFIITQHIHQRMHSSTSAGAGDQSDGLNQDARFHHLQVNGHAHLDDDQSANGFPSKGAPATETPHDKGQHQQMLPICTKACNPIRMVFVEGGCPPEKHAHLATASEAYAAAHDMKGQVEQLLSDIMQEQQVAFLLADILLGWASESASKYGLPWVCFWAAAAATFAGFQYCADLAREGKRIPIAENQDGRVTVIDGIPGLPPTPLHDLHRTWDDEGRLIHVALNYFQATDRARCVLLNTFEELEGQVLQALSKRYPTVAVGPLVPSRYMSDNFHTCPDRRADTIPYRTSLFKEETACLEWLDKQSPFSVIFISFGSISARTPEQLDELAHGVTASGCPFLWVQRPDISTGSKLGVQQRGNGLVVPWAPQLDVLAHPAIGGFITHCGWNSIMEAVAMGVPMLCWADTGERLSNQRFVVQFWKCGLDMVSDTRRHMQHIDGGAVLIRREEIERSIRCLMLEEVGASIRAQAAYLRDAAMLAARNSNSYFNRLMDHTL
ncbi:hypothetical protein L7F22_022126 [Adiantum nelumboides]|nr:hypothetical protein [Adiantum nelumboides]